MKRLLALLVAVGGIGLLFTRLRHRGRVEEPASVVDPRADELRRKLAETRTAPAASARDERPVAGTDPADVAAARQRVYEQGRMAVDEMQRAGTEPPA